MYIQVIRGKVTSEADASARLDTWQKELGPGADGFLGTTGGVTDDGTLIQVVRFESAEAARRNSERPEQGEWWNETAKIFTGDVTFYDCPEVDRGLGGGSDTAGFVQVMVSKVTDVPALRALTQRFTEQMPGLRPDLVGFTDAYTNDGICVTTSYFTSEAEAREGEKKDMPAEGAELFAQYEGLVSDVEYFDLKNPWFFSA